MTFHSILVKETDLFRAKIIVTGIQPKKPTAFCQVAVANR